jgi:hypothetical protein
MAALTDDRSVTSTRWKITPYLGLRRQFPWRRRGHSIATTTENPSVARPAAIAPSDTAGRAGHNRSIALI